MAKDWTPHDDMMEMVEISKLVPYVNNARTHSPEQIMKLRYYLCEFGFINPIIIDSKFNIIAGMEESWLPRKKRWKN